MTDDTRARLRDEMAMAALTKLIVRATYPDSHRADICEASYRWADSMLAAREEGSR